MGWTHHWSRPVELPADRFESAVRDFKRIQERVRIELAGFDGTGQPVIDNDHIVFNGVAPYACEPFEIARVEFDRHGRMLIFSFCKTGQFAYDVCVRAALIILKSKLGDDLMRVWSDGGEGDWQAARELVVGILGYGDRFRLDVDE